MPELPELAIAGAFLARHAAGRVVRDVALPDPAAVRTHLSTRPADARVDAAAWWDGLRGALPGTPIRHGKRLWWPVAGLQGVAAADGGLLVHLGMSGRWVLRGDDAPPPHGRVGVRTDAGWLWLVDPRRFGCVVPAAPDAGPAALVAGLGPDAATLPSDGAALAARLAGARTLKAGLLDQRRLAGLGNIQAVEALFRAGLHPARAAVSLDASAWARLAEGIAAALEHALAVTLPEDGDDVLYLSGGAANPFLVYGRAGLPCVRCGGVVESGRDAGRSTTWCPSCQPPP